MCFSPIVIVLIIITLVSVVLGLRQAKNIQAEGDVASGSKRAPLIFLLAVMGYVAVAYGNASLVPDFAKTDRVIPIFVSTIALIGCALLVVQMIRAPETNAVFADRELQDADVNTYGLWPTLAWVCGAFDRHGAGRIYPCFGRVSAAVYQVPCGQKLGVCDRLHGLWNRVHLCHGMDIEP